MKGISFFFHSIIFLTFHICCAFCIDGGGCWARFAYFTYFTNKIFEYFQMPFSNQPVFLKKSSPNNRHHHHQREYNPNE